MDTKTNDITVLTNEAFDQIPDLFIKAETQYGKSPGYLPLEVEVSKTTKAD